MGVRKRYVEARDEDGNRVISVSWQRYESSGNKKIRVMTHKGVGTYNSIWLNQDIRSDRLRSSNDGDTFFLGTGHYSREDIMSLENGESVWALLKVVSGEK